MLHSQNLTCSLKGDHSEREMSSSNHQFSGDVLVFRGVVVLLLCSAARVPGVASFWFVGDTLHNFSRS